MLAFSVKEGENNILTYFHFFIEPFIDFNGCQNLNIPLPDGSPDYLLILAADLNPTGYENQKTGILCGGNSFCRLLA